MEPCIANSNHIFSFVFLLIKIGLHSVRSSKILATSTSSPYCSITPAVLYSLLNASTWDLLSLISLNVDLQALLSNVQFECIATSDIDTPEYRSILLHAAKQSIHTISYPHGYFLYKRAPYMYLASSICVHGELESNFALSVGVSIDSLVMLGGGRDT